MRGPSNRTIAVLAITASTGSLSVGYWLVRRCKEQESKSPTSLGCVPYPAIYCSARVPFVLLLRVQAPVNWCLSRSFSLCVSLDRKLHGQHVFGALAGSCGKISVVIIAAKSAIEHAPCLGFRVVVHKVAAVTGADFLALDVLCA